MPAPVPPPAVRNAARQPHRACNRCGCYEPFAGATDECCINKYGEHCQFEHFTRLLRPSSTSVAGTVPEDNMNTVDIDMSVPDETRDAADIAVPEEAE